MMKLASIFDNLVCTEEVVGPGSSGCVDGLCWIDAVSMNGIALLVQICDNKLRSTFLDCHHCVLKSIEIVFFCHLPLILPVESPLERQRSPHSQCALQSGLLDLGAP